MTKKPDENREEDVELEDQEDDTAEGEDADSPSDEGKEDEKEQDADEGEDESEDESDEESEDGEEDADESDEDGEEDESEDDGVEPPKFKGKTREEVIASYRHLEKLLETKALQKAQELLSKKGGDKKKEKPVEDDFDKVDFDKMSPKEFARWMTNQIDVRATRKAREIVEKTAEMRTSVSREIREASKEHPNLKDNPDYREVVLAMIESAAGRGQVLTLKQACQKADKALGIKPGEKKKDDEGKDEKKKKPKTDTERGGGGEGGKPKTDEEKVLDGIRGGGANTGGLGGLGI